MRNKSILDKPCDLSDYATIDYVDSGTWLLPPVIDWYDPIGGLPADPSVGDRYISDGTAEGWTDGYIYEWTGSEWEESEPVEGWMIWVLFELMLYAFFSGGWMEVGEGVDHGGLSGLADDDHAQYILVAGTRAFTGDQAMGVHKFTGLSVPVNAGDSIRATTKITEVALETAIDLKHSTVSVLAPLFRSVQEISLVNNAVSPGTISTIDIDKTFAANSDLYIPTQKAVKGAIADHSALITGVHGLVITAGQTLTVEASSVLNQDLTTDAGPSFAHLHLADLAAIYTAAESWIGPSSTTGIYFKGGKVGVGTVNPTDNFDVVGTDVGVAQSIGIGPIIMRHWTFTANAYNATKNKYDLTIAAPDYAGDLILSPQGNVGIGTTAPLSKLCINGGLHVGGDSDAGDNNLLVDGTATITGAFGCNGVAAGTKSEHIADATGAADVITRANAILVVLEKFGFVATP